MSKYFFNLLSVFALCCLMLGCQSEKWHNAENTGLKYRIESVSMTNPGASINNEFDSQLLLSIAKTDSSMDSSYCVLMKDSISVFFGSIWFATPDWTSTGIHDLFGTDIPTASLPASPQELYVSLPFHSKMDSIVFHIPLYYDTCFSHEKELDLTFLYLPKKNIGFMKVLSKRK